MRPSRTSGCSGNRNRGRGGVGAGSGQQGHGVLGRPCCVTVVGSQRPSEGRQACRSSEQLRNTPSHRKLLQLTEAGPLTAYSRLRSFAVTKMGTRPRGRTAAQSWPTDTECGLSQRFISSPAQAWPRAGVGGWSGGVAAAQLLLPPGAFLWFDLGRPCSLSPDVTPSTTHAAPLAPACTRQAPPLALQVLRVDGALRVLEVACPRIQIADHQAGGLPCRLGVPGCGRKSRGRARGSRLVGGIEGAERSVPARHHMRCHLSRPAPPSWEDATAHRAPTLPTHPSPPANA